jgi:hypothetical protein
MDEQEQSRPEELEKAAVLPAREAMSIISPELASPDLVPDIDAAATGGENVSSEDQSVQATSHDSASSQT